MQLKQSIKFALLVIIFSIQSLCPLNANLLPHEHEKIFAANASRHELIEAYLNKCGEVHYLKYHLEEAQKNYYSWKNMKQAFGIGAVVSAAALAIVYIATR